MNDGNTKGAETVPEPHIIGRVGLPTLTAALDHRLNAGATEDHAENNKKLIYIACTNSDKSNSWYQWDSSI